MGKATLGKNGLYYAQINPDPAYPMTQPECIRAADILEEKLG